MERHGRTRGYAPDEESRSLLTVSELATRLRIARTSVYSLPIPYVLVLTRRRYRPDDVEAYLNRDRHEDA